MSKKDTRLVYTTDPVEARRLRETSATTVTTDVPPEQQVIRVEIDRKRRKGKTVTVASGFQLTKSSLDSVAKSLKTRCAAGGKQDKDEIEIQGDHIDAVADVLAGLGYRVRKIGRS
jgi:translation initiation factor 1